MQGATAKHGAVIEPSSAYPFARGLDYVAASRPTELSKLFLLSPLNNTHFTAWPQERLEVKKEYIRLAKVSLNQQKTIDTSMNRSNSESTETCASNDDHDWSNDTSRELTHESSSYESCLVCGEMMYTRESSCQLCNGPLHSICATDVSGHITSYVSEEWCSFCFQTNWYDNNT
jgi:hypothetical protein